MECLIKKKILISRCVLRTRFFGNNKTNMTYAEYAGVIEMKMLINQNNMNMKSHTYLHKIETKKIINRKKKNNSCNCRHISSNSKRC